MHYAKCFNAGLFVEVRVPQAKPLLVRLSLFQLNIRPGRSAHTVRDEILAVLPELIDEDGEFRLRDLVARLNPDNDLRRRWAVERTLSRLFVGGLPDGGNFVRSGWGRYLATE